MHNKSNLVSIWDFPQLARFDQYYYLKGKVKANQVLLQSAPYHVPAATSHSCFLYAAVSWKGKQSVKKTDVQQKAKQTKATDDQHCLDTLWL